MDARVGQIVAARYTLNEENVLPQEIFEPYDGLTQERDGGRFGSEVVGCHQRILRTGLDDVTINNYLVHLTYHPRSSVMTLGCSAIQKTNTCNWTVSSFCVASPVGVMRV